MTNILKETKGLELDQRIESILGAVNCYTLKQIEELTSYYRASHFFIVCERILRMSPEEKEVTAERYLRHLRESVGQQGADLWLLDLILCRISEGQLKLARKCWLYQIEMEGYPYDREEMVLDVKRLSERVADGILNNTIPEKGFEHVFMLTMKYREQLVELGKEELIQSLFSTFCLSNSYHKRHSQDYQFIFNKKGLENIENLIFSEG